MALVVIVRSEYFHFPPSIVFGHPGYFFWSTLFWSGLLLVAIRRAESKQWPRWPIYLAALALPGPVLPKRYKGGLLRREIRSEAESSAPSFVDEYRCHELQIGILGAHVDRAA